MPEPDLRRLPETPVSRHPAADHDRGSGIRRLGRLDPLQERVHDRLLVAGGQVGPLLVADRLAFADLVEEGGLDAAEAEVQPRGPRPGEGDGLRVTGRRQLVDRGPTRKGQAQDARALVEGLAGRIVTGPADHGDVAVWLPTDEVAVTA